MNSVHICLANTEKLLDQMYRLRYEIYTTEIKSFTKEQLVSGIEKDCYDNYSVHIVACRCDEVVGTLRLVKDSPHGFVMEQTFEIPSFIDRTCAVEHSRGIVRKQFRGTSVYTKMLEYAYTWQKNNGFPICLGAPNIEKLHQILLTAGWKEFGISKEHHSIVVVPMYYDLTTTV